MMIKSIKIFGIFLLLGTILTGQSLIFEASAANSREVKLTTPFPRIEVYGGEDIQLDVNITNTGDVEEILDLTILRPQNWETALKSEGYMVKSIFLTPDESRSIDFEASPSSEVGEGSYNFVIEARSGDEVIESSLGIRVDVQAATLAGISLSTPHHSVEGPSGREYTFTLTVNNLADEERVIGFTAFGPSDWRMTFKPTYTEEQISSLEFNAGQRRTVEVKLSPPIEVKPGDYNVTVIATSGPVIESLDISVTIIGTYLHRVSTPEGLLSMDAMQGEEAYVTLILTNEGSAPLEEAFFSAQKPYGWDVIFEPNEIPGLEPDVSREIRVIIKPTLDAIPGDYSVTLRSHAEPYSFVQELELRVTVLASVTWGLVGLGVIVAAVAILFAIYWRLGRR